MLVGVAFANVAGAAPYQLDGLGAGCVEPGNSNTVHGNGFSKDSNVGVFVGDEQVGVLQSDAGGVVDGAFTVPSDFPTGDTQVKLVGPSPKGTRTLTFDMTVGCTGPEAGAGGATNGEGSGTGALAFTGGNVGMTVGIASALLVVGVAFLAARRKKSTSDVAS
jgi:hypothetical protein